MTTLAELRKGYHVAVGERIVRFSTKGGVAYPNFADGSSRSSVLIANGVSDALGYSSNDAAPLPVQRTGSLFETLTCRFIEEAFDALAHLRPGRWQYLTTRTRISGFEQYRHLDLLGELVSDHRDLSAALGHGYIVTPDIVIAKTPTSQEEVNSAGVFLDDSSVASLTPFLGSNRSPSLPFLHASVSCKWTIRSDRSQNTRTEALNLIRNRKGRLPHIVAVTAEPLPMRIASLALGTGDLDCVYHFALDELREVCETLPGLEDQAEMLGTMIDGDRLRDISDLPLDLAV